jgi:hypothetical protein
MEIIMWIAVGLGLLLAGIIGVMCVCCVLAIPKSKEEREEMGLEEEEDMYGDTLLFGDYRDYINFWKDGEGNYYWFYSDLHLDDTPDNSADVNKVYGPCSSPNEVWAQAEEIFGKDGHA